MWVIEQTYAQNSYSFQEYNMIISFQTSFSISKEKVLADPETGFYVCVGLFLKEKKD